MVFFRVVITSLLAFCVFQQVQENSAHAETSAQTVLQRVLAEEFTPTELVHFTTTGYYRVTPSRFLTDNWDVTHLEKLAQDAERAIKNDDGKSLHHALAHAGSPEAAIVYRKLAMILQKFNIKSVSRTNLEKHSEAILNDYYTRTGKFHVSYLLGEEKFNLKIKDLDHAQVVALKQLLDGGSKENLKEALGLYTSYLQNEVRYMSPRLLAINAYLFFYKFLFNQNPVSQSIAKTLHLIDQRIVVNQDSSQSFNYGVPFVESATGKVQILWVNSNEAKTEFKFRDNPMDQSSPNVDTKVLAGVLKTVLSSEELFQLTSEGMTAILSLPYFIQPLSPTRLLEIAEDLGTIRKANYRSSAPLQIFHASSNQAKIVYEKLAKLFTDYQIQGVFLNQVQQAAQVAYLETQKQEGFGATFHIKSGSFSPIVQAKNMSAKTYSKIQMLFSDDMDYEALFDRGKTSVKDQLLKAKGLSDRAIHELKGLRMATALFEREFPILRDDIGGWGGNLNTINWIKRNIIDPYYDQVRENVKFVCTDEAMTTMFFVRHLMLKGMVREFEIVDFRFGHRFNEFKIRGRYLRQPLSDHFGVLIRHKDTGNYFVIDTWVEDGGQPAHILTLDDWLDHGEAKGQDVVDIAEHFDSFESMLDHAYANQQYLKKNCESNF